MRKRTLIVLAALPIFLATSALGAAPKKVLGTSTKAELWSSVEGNYLAFTKAPKFAPNEGVIYVKRRGEHSVRVTPKGHVSSRPDLDLRNERFGNVLVYTDLNGNPSADLALWDLRAKTHLHVPDGINTGDSDEAWGTISGRYLLFSRGPVARQAKKVMLYDLRHKRFRTLADADVVGVGNVNGDWATWWACKSNLCRLWRYRISHRKLTEVPLAKPGLPYVYSPIVTHKGAVYYVQRGVKCGATAAIYRNRVAGGTRTIAKMPKGVDAFLTDVEEGGGARPMIYFGRTVCKSQNTDVYKVAG